MRRSLLPLAIALLLPLGAGAQARPAAPRPAPPTLLVFLTVDQLRPDYLDRWPGQLTGGLARLAKDGAFFTHAVHDHATTETAPGHASTMSGRFPASTGIVRNNAGVADPQSPLLNGSRGWGASPYRFRGTVLFDWVRFRDPRARALSISRKDRGAILPMGRAKQQVYWYGTDGGFTTSSYYADTLPGWMRRFNATRGGRRYAGRTWELLLPAARYPERDSVDVESNGRNYAFPHRLPADSAQAARLLGEMWFMDELTLDAALTGVNELQLGAGPQLDLLAVSLSTTDAVGHRYGPDSREVHDQVLRVDRLLGAFLDSLFRLRDPAKVIIALTADHGVAPIPEVHFAGKPGVGVLRAPVDELARETMQRLAARGLDAEAFDFEYGLVFMDRARFAAARVDADSMLADFLRRARQVPGVQRADTRVQLARADTTKDHVARRWLHALPPDLPVVATVTLEPYVYWPNVTQASHGSPHDYDARVPVIFWGAPFRAGRFAGSARVVDMAPTLAHVLGITPSERLDGRVLRDALRDPSGAGERWRGTGDAGPGSDARR